jgi:murein DD-endopeptidase MepM/ murein hydrolase activator NlpD
MFSYFFYFGPIKRLFFNGLKEKYWKRIRGLSKNLLFFLGIISIILFIILFFAPFLKSLPEMTETSFFLAEQNRKSKMEEKTSFFSFNPRKKIQSGPEEFTFQNLFLSSADQFLVESPNFLFVEKNSLRAVSPPSLVSPQILGALIGEYQPEEPKKLIREYFVEEGDSLSSLASQFGISLETILWANDLTEKSTIKPGQKLIIPPVSGVIYHVKSGDTLSEIAKTYKGKIEEIIAFNELSNENDLYIGDILIIPNGLIPQPSAKSSSAPLDLPLANNQFILPVSSPYIITQGLHWYNAIDFSHPGYACGKPVFAVAGGLVQKTDYNRILGNYLRILHPNGVVTLYAHLSQITVKKGQRVNTGEIIGYIGNTGYTKGVTGCHLHFEVRGAENPFAKINPGY